MANAGWGGHPAELKLPSQAVFHFTEKQRLPPACNQPPVLLTGIDPETDTHFIRIQLINNP